ncbi:hypothetical protein [Muricoccus radiodurans]|uniref:hypothetical protein n=1 Tax=Muricoccus radiodurans TaxID=2231721 RepID=UPI003CE8D671
MGLISFLQKAAKGQTTWQGQRRYERASNRGTLYVEVCQWHLYYGEGSPILLQNYAELVQQCTFRPEHQASLVGIQADINRKLGHAATMNVGNNPFLSPFVRPADNTVFVVFAVLRDGGQQFAMLKPYWFLSAGEKESDFRQAVVEFIPNRGGR